MCVCLSVGKWVRQENQHQHERQLAFRRHNGFIPGSRRPFSRFVSFICYLTLSCTDGDNACHLLCTATFSSSFPNEHPYSLSCSLFSFASSSSSILSDVRVTHTMEDPCCKNYLLFCLLLVCVRRSLLPNLCSHPESLDFVSASGERDSCSRRGIACLVPRLLLLFSSIACR